MRRIYIGIIVGAIIAIGGAAWIGYHAGFNAGRRELADEINQAAAKSIGKLNAIGAELQKEYERKGLARPATRTR